MRQDSVSDGRLSRSAPQFLIVSDRADELCRAISHAVQSRGARASHLPWVALSAIRVRLDGDNFQVNGEPTAGLYLRLYRHLSCGDGFRPEDRDFCDAEARALWLAAQHLPSMFSVNRYDAAAWFAPGEWSTWRSRLRAAGVPVAPFVVGDMSALLPRWFPYSGDAVQQAPSGSMAQALGSALSKAAPKRSYLTAFGGVLATAPPSSVRHAASVLYQAGIGIAQVVVDAEGRLLSINTRPAIGDSRTNRKVAELVADRFYAHLRTW